MLIMSIIFGRPMNPMQSTQNNRVKIVNINCNWSIIPEMSTKCCTGTIRSVLHIY